MNLQNVSVSQVLAIITNAVSQFISLALVLMIGAAVLSHIGIAQSFIRVLDPTTLAYLCGAWYLYRK